MTRSSLRRVKRRTAQIPIERWSTGYHPHDDPYLAPEMRKLVLRGFVKGQPIATSPIVSVRGRLVTTESGSIYKLGKPDPEWIRWLAEQGRALDDQNPIKINEP